MTDCRQIESLLPPFVDGDADARTRQTVEAHLAGCAACRGRVAAERTARTVMRARASALAAVAPPGLHTRLAALAAERAAGERRLGWRGRLTAFAAAGAAVVLAVAGLELVDTRSNVLHAAQLAIDHVRCFVVERATRAPADPEQVKSQVAQKYGWSIDVPPSNQDAGVTLVAVRRCPFWIGSHAHLLYRTGEHQVSLYVTPGEAREHADLHVLGHNEKVWTSGGASYVMVTDGLTPEELARISAYLQRETQGN